MARENAEKIDKSLKENEDLVKQIDEESRNYDIEQYDVTKVDASYLFARFTKYFETILHPNFLRHFMKEDTHSWTREGKSN